jgi:hypothetical protein
MKSKPYNMPYAKSKRNSDKRFLHFADQYLIEQGQIGYHTTIQFA